MNVCQCATSYVISITPSASVAEAAKLMRAQHVGFLVVAHEPESPRRPVGVVTDRDIVVQVVAAGINPERVKVGDVMTEEPLLATDTDELDSTLQEMRRAGVRRVPVIDGRECLVGILALDDAIAHIARLMCDIAGSVRTEIRHERDRRIPTEDL
jgi:CBS domain-containing protein